jgi:hypothetical protein
MDFIERTLYKSNVSNGNRIYKVDKLSEFQEMDIIRGKRNKRLIDKNLKGKGYETLKTIHTPLLTYFENREWYQRDTTFDFDLILKK